MKLFIRVVYTGYCEKCVISRDECDSSSVMHLEKCLKTHTRKCFKRVAPAYKKKSVFLKWSNMLAILYTFREVFKNTFERKGSVHGPTVFFISKDGNSISKDICVLGRKKVGK